MLHRRAECAMLRATGAAPCSRGRGQEDPMARTYFPLTTPSQRRLLFATWEATGDVEEACRVAHMGRRTFYYWKPRFEAGGYPALERFASRAPRRPRRTAPAVEERVVALRRERPDWGRR